MIEVATVLTRLLAIANPIPGAGVPPNSGSSAERVGMPITRPFRSASAPPELPGLISALVWIADVSVTPFPSDTVRLTEETMPCETLECRPSGLPIARARDPTRDWQEA